VPFPVEWRRELGVLNSPTTIRWQNASGGDEFVFTGSPDNLRSGIFVLEGATGLGLAPADQIVTDYPALDGGFLQGGRSGVREIQLPLFIWGQNRAEFMRLVNALSETMSPDTPRRLVVEDKTFPRVRVRYIECYYAGGWDGDESEEASGLTWARIPLELRCPDPWFHEDTEESFTFSAGQSTITIPELLGGLAWPTFRFSMPYGSADPEIVNVTTGRSLRLNFTAGIVIVGDDGDDWVLVEDDGTYTPDVLDVDTAPRQRSVRVNDATAWDSFDFASDWFSVRTGDEITVTVEELEGYPGWTAEMTIKAYHRKGI
jgi:hypothetical protein